MALDGTKGYRSIRVAFQNVLARCYLPSGGPQCLHLLKGSLVLLAPVLSAYDLAFWAVVATSIAGSVTPRVLKHC